ncbi:MAG: hypothetical protein ACNYPH_02355 [Gammaproteobacteria bacterium WSBS_2016_MAG_OTU1]
MNYGTATESNTFSVTHARHIAAKVATDLKRMQRFYSLPNDEDIDDYEKEIIALLQGNYIDWVVYGFQDSNKWVVALKYAARHGGILIEDDSPGRIPIGHNISRCSFTSLLSYTNKWNQLNDDQKKQVYIKANVLSFKERVTGRDYYGAWRSSDKVYSAGGRGVLRHTVGG